ncbi:MAG: SPASM domain-containing protein, partial [Deltaproteobacteria bacterium]|nr:SPASM domain-containing protein [Deltaproteobacteria bacterium]
CPSESMKRKKAIMPRKLWEKILIELGDKKMTHTVFFHVLGEPLLHKDVFDAILLANSQNLSVSLYTNGALLDNKRSTKLLDVLKKGRVVLSMQDISPESFGRRCRGTLSWREYIQRLQKFMQFAETREKPVPVQVHCMIDIHSMGWNLPKIVREQRRIQAVYDQWRTSLGMGQGKKVNVFDPAASYPLGKHSSLFVKHAGNWDNQLVGDEFEIVPRDRGHCALITDTFAILSNGTCTYCCDDYEGKLNLGNAHEKSLEEIYYGEKATSIREAEERGKFIEERCKECRGTLINKKTRKPVTARNILTDYYIFREHLSRYGFRSVNRKIIEAAKRRRWI